jgi:hypothetical protein
VPDVPECTETCPKGFFYPLPAGGLGPCPILPPLPIPSLLSRHHPTRPLATTILSDSPTPAASVPLSHPSTSQTSFEMLQLLRIRTTLFPNFEEGCLLRNWQPSAKQLPVWRVRVKGRVRGLGLILLTSYYLSSPKIPQQGLVLYNLPPSTSSYREWSDIINSHHRNVPYGSLILHLTSNLHLSCQKGVLSDTLLHLTQGFHRFPTVPPPPPNNNFSNYMMLLPHATFPTCEEVGSPLIHLPY